MNGIRHEQEQESVMETHEIPSHVGAWATVEEALESEAPWAPERAWLGSAPCVVVMDAEEEEEVEDDEDWADDDEDEDTLLDDEDEDFAEDDDEFAEDDEDFDEEALVDDEDEEDEL